MLAQSNPEIIIKEKLLSFFFIIMLTFSYIFIFFLFTGKYNIKNFIQEENLLLYTESRKLQISGNNNKKFIDDFNNARLVYDTVQTRTYKGVWNSSNKSNEFMDFDKSYGELILSFEREQISLTINNGGYNDKRIKFGFLVNYNSHITKIEENIYRLKYNSKILVTHIEYLSEIKKESNINFNIDCYNEIVILFEELISNKFFANINGKVESSCKGFQFNFTAILLDNPKEITNKWKIRIFILIIVIVGTLQLIISFQQLRILSFNLSLAKNVKFG